LRTSIYIAGWRVDQFKDESVSVVSSVLDISDITKNTGDYTKTFTVPSSKRNNIIFKHWYDANIDNSFDARTKVSGEITLDGLPFKSGKFRLSKVNVKKNKPASYTINFFGNLVNLKTLVGKDELSDLNLTAYDHDYTSANVKTGLQVGGLLSGDIIYNLLAKKRYIYDSTNATDVSSGNISNIAFINSGTSTGVKWDELRASIKVLKIIEAIETDYDITFSRDFFATSEFTELFMWLNPDKDKEIGLQTQIADWTGGSPVHVNHSTNVGTFTIEPYSSFDFRVSVSATNVIPQRVVLSMFVDGVKTNEVDEFVAGGALATSTIMFSSITSETLVDKEVYFTVQSKYADLTLQWTQTKYDSAGVQVGSVENTSGYNAVTATFGVSNSIPKMKIIDFLKGLFNCYKLVVVPQDNGTLYVDTLSSYYSSGNIYDVTKYVDNSSYDVERGDILNEIELKFQEPTTLLNIEFEKNNQRGYGDEQIILKDENDELYDGESLKFTVPFEQVVYERLTDEGNGLKTVIQYGAIIGEDLEPASPKAHLFYNRSININSYPIAFLDENLAVTEVGSNINTPFHQTTTSATIFKDEFSTYNGYNITENLYSNHYAKYVDDIFNIKKRVFKYQAQLPIHIITNLQLNDTLKIKGNYFKIDKYSYNLLTGKTTLTLINNFDVSIGEPTASSKSIASDYIAKAEITQVTSLQASTETKVDNGYGTTWATVTSINNNLSIALDEFTTTNGTTRSMFVDIAGATKTERIFIKQKDKGHNPTADSNIVTADSNIIKASNNGATIS
tara:strand:- start:2798 stop:5164 length:2367 start_codon:yes stop_codon:yes gene_type:complete